MRTHISRIGGGLVATVVFATVLLMTDIPKALEQADKSFAFIAKSLGVAAPPEHFVSAAWAHPWAVALAFVGVFAVGILLSWGVETWWHRLTGRTSRSDPPPAFSFHHDDHRQGAEQEPVLSTKQSPVASHHRNVSDLLIEAKHESNRQAMAGRSASDMLAIGSPKVDDAIKHLVGYLEGQIKTRQAKIDPDQEFHDAWKESTTDRIPFVRLRDIAPEFGLALSTGDPSAANLAYEIEDALRQAAVDEELDVWGRKFRGPVKSNDPLVQIPANHFEDYEFGHGNLHYETENDQSHTGLLTKRLEEMTGEVFYDLQLSNSGARAVLRRFRDEQG